MSGALVWVGHRRLRAPSAPGRASRSAPSGSRRGVRATSPSARWWSTSRAASALGLLVGLAVSGDALLVLGTGFLGGYTTFSTWMVEAQRLGEDSEWRLMWLYLLVSMVAGLAATALGLLVGGALA